MSAQDQHSLKQNVNFLYQRLEKLFAGTRRSSERKLTRKGK